jgi:hypothetical protein
LRSTRMHSSRRTLRACVAWDGTLHWAPANTLASVDSASHSVFHAQNNAAACTPVGQRALVLPLHRYSQPRGSPLPPSLDQPARSTPQQRTSLPPRARPRRIRTSALCQCIRFPRPLRPHTAHRRRGAGHRCRFASHCRTESSWAARNRSRATGWHSDCAQATNGRVQAVATDMAR